MGKIYDALEKAQQEKMPTIEVGKGPAVHFHEPGQKKDGQLKLLEPLHLSQNIDSNLVTYHKPQSLESEMFKMLRGNILFPVDKSAPPKSILVTSALPGEGKSFVSTNLAVSIAHNINEHVLLMDCDVRRPSVHRVFGFDDIPGLTDYLTQNTPLHDVLVKTDIKKLTILPGGDPPPNPAELLSSKEMTSLLAEVKERYKDRFIIIDSPPPQLTAETSALARQVDGVILVVKSGSTPREMVADLIESIGREKILGIVMNYFDLRSSSYYGYGKHGKYGKYYRK